MLFHDAIEPATLALLKRLQACAKYPTANPALAMRSLSYFVDAETMPMPKMLIPFDWDEAKDRIRAAVRKLAV